MRRRVPMCRRPLSSGVLYHPANRHAHPAATTVTFYGGRTMIGGTYTVIAGASTFSYRARKGTKPETIARKLREGITREMRR